MPRPRKSTYTDDKPPFSYVALCVMAIRSSNKQMMTLSEIYRYIMERFPFYRRNCQRWQNSLRHNLSFNDCFIRVQGPSDVNFYQNYETTNSINATNHQSISTKTSYWALHPRCTDMFNEGSLLRRKRRFRTSEKNSFNDKKSESDDLRTLNSTPNSFNQKAINVQLLNKNNCQLTFSIDRILSN